MTIAFAFSRKLRVQQKLITIARGAIYFRITILEAILRRTCPDRLWNARWGCGVALTSPRSPTSAQSCARGSPKPWGACAYLWALVPRGLALIVATRLGPWGAAAVAVPVVANATRLPAEVTAIADGPTGLPDHPFTRAARNMPVGR